MACGGVLSCSSVMLWVCEELSASQVLNLSKVGQRKVILSGWSQVLLACNGYVSELRLEELGVRLDNPHNNRNGERLERD